MPKDVIPIGGCRSGEIAAGGELPTGFAPPFRALFGAPASATSVPSPPPPEPEPRSGAADAPELPAVPGYEVVAELGRGGMGVVYLARQRSLKRLVALKMIRTGLHAEPKARARFR